jgi:hypothetical protein
MYATTSFRPLALLVLLTGLATCLLMAPPARCQWGGFQARRGFTYGQQVSFRASRWELQQAQLKHNQQAQAAQMQRQAQAAQVQRRGAQPPGPNRSPKGEHLAEWMNQHNALSLTQQQQALQREPGFHELPPQTQQRELDRLAQLNAMSPQQRDRLIRNNEHLETLSPDQRGQVRGAMQQLGALPPDQRRMVAHNFRELRDLPPDQRAAAMSRMPLNDAQRATLGNLLRVEPLLPPPDKQ